MNLAYQLTTALLVDKCSVIYHTGSSHHEGHFCVLIHKPDGRLVLCNDESVTDLSTVKDLLRMYPKASPYMLMYTRHAGSGELDGTLRRSKRERPSAKVCYNE